MINALRRREDWTDEEKEVLKRAWVDNSTYPNITSIIKGLFPERTQHSLTSAARRFKLPMRHPKKERRIDSDGVDRRKGPRVKILPSEFDRDVTPLAPTPILTKLTHSQNVTLMELAKNGCHFVTIPGNKEKLARFCGAKVTPGRPYCPYHLAIVYVRQPT